MQALKRDEWLYSFLLILLFAIASLAAKAAIDYIVPMVSGNSRVIVIIVICALTLGLMSVSAAFALWAIGIKSDITSARRTADIVNAMSYISDGALAVTRKGRISGMNPAARKMFSITSLHSVYLSEICPELTEHDIDQLTGRDQSEEIEREVQISGFRHTLRFRSQASKNMSLILVNDVTKLTDMRTHLRHAAHLQIIGHIAQGIANDFNNILCGISGHASLILRDGASTGIIKQSAEAINNSINRGIQLVSNLLDLSLATENSQDATISPENNINLAADAIASGLHSDWKVDRSVSPGVKPINISGALLEHIIHGLGMLAADIYSQDRYISILLCPPTDAGICHIDGKFAGVIIITPTNLDQIAHSRLKAYEETSTGTIQSVVGSILKQYGGRLESFFADSGIPVYRICLPHASPGQLHSQQKHLTPGLEAYIANWHVMLCGRHTKLSRNLQNYLQDCDVDVKHTANIVDTLAAIENSSGIHALVINAGVLGNDKPGLLRAIRKLCPDSGIVVIDRELPDSPLAGIFFATPEYSPAQIVQSMIESRTNARSES